MLNEPLGNPLGNHWRRAFVTSLLVATLAIGGTGMARAQAGAPATPAKISTVYTGDVINGKKVVSSLNTAETWAR